MARVVDERLKAELYKINQGRFFVSYIITLVFLYSKISNQAGILGMLGELTAATVMLLYLIPYFVIRYRYKTIDEMVIFKLNKLSTMFLILVFVCLIPVVTIDIVLLSLNWDGTIYVMQTSFLFVIVLGIAVGIYGAVKKHNAKFATAKMEQMSLKTYTKRLVIKSVAATLILLAVGITISAVLDYVQGLPQYIGTETGPWWAILMGFVMLLCYFCVPVVWAMFLYYLGIRRKYEQKIGASGQSDAEKL